MVIKMKMPVKTKILDYILEQQEPVSAEKVSEAMKTIYGDIRYCSLAKIKNQMNTYCGVGILKAENTSYTESGKLYIEYTATDYGRKCAEYIPKG